MCLLLGHPTSGLGKKRDLSQKIPVGPTPATRRISVRSTSSSTDREVGPLIGDRRGQGPKTHTLRGAWEVV